MLFLFFCVFEISRGGGVELYVRFWKTVRQNVYLHSGVSSSIIYRDDCGLDMEDKNLNNSIYYSLYIGT